MDFFGSPLIIERWSSRLSSDAGLVPLRRIDQRIRLTRRCPQALDDPRAANRMRVLLSRDSAYATRQQNGDNIGCVSPTWLLCHWEKSSDVIACHTSQ